MRRRYTSWAWHFPVVRISASFSAIDFPMPGIVQSAFAPPSRWSSASGRSYDSIASAAFS